MTRREVEGKKRRGDARRLVVVVVACDKYIIVLRVPLHFLLPRDGGSPPSLRSGPGPCRVLYTFRKRQNRGELSCTSRRRVSPVFALSSAVSPSRSSVRRRVRAVWRRGGSIGGRARSLVPFSSRRVSRTTKPPKPRVSFLLLVVKKDQIPRDHAAIAPGETSPLLNDSRTHLGRCLTRDAQPRHLLEVLRVRRPEQRLRLVLPAGSPA